MTYSTARKVESSFDMKISAHRDTSKPENTAVMPDIYGNACKAKKANPVVVSRSSPNTDKSDGFDPYDTGVLQQQKIQG